MVNSYKDYASIRGNDLPELPSNALSKRGAKVTFHEKLHALLDDNPFEDVISWQSHGRSFSVHKPDRFVAEVMPKYFKQSKFSSFLRQLNLYSFTRQRALGPDKGGYYHKFFLRGRGDLCSYLTRMAVKGPVLRNIIETGPEPNFHGMRPSTTNTGTVPGEAASSTDCAAPACSSSSSSVSSDATSTHRVAASMHSADAARNAYMLSAVTTKKMQPPTPVLLAYRTLSGSELSLVKEGAGQVAAVRGGTILSRTPDCNITTDNEDSSSSKWRTTSSRSSHSWLDAHHSPMQYEDRIVRTRETRDDSRTWCENRFMQTDCNDIDSNFALSDIEPVDIFGIEAAQDISTIPSFPIREFWRKVSSLLACVNDDGDTSGIDDES